MGLSRRQDALDRLPTKSAKIRMLAEKGVPRAEIARQLNIRYQHVRNVLERDLQKKVGTSVQAEAADPEASVKVRIGPEGRVLVPAAFRERLGIKEGDVLFARIEDGELIFLTPQAAMRRAQAIVRRFVPDDISLVDELIADRRREAAREDEDND